jgi:hypothetical protein
MHCVKKMFIYMNILRERVHCDYSYRKEHDQVYIEGYVSKNNIRRWLDNYTAMVLGDKPLNAMPTNCSPKDYDGVTGGRLNKIMLDDAIKKLSNLEWTCLSCKWIREMRTTEALQVLRITKAEYTRGCNAAIDSIYASINGPMAGIKRLMKQIAQ